jgi:hypothetical protein
VSAAIAAQPLQALFDAINAPVRTLTGRSLTGTGGGNGGLLLGQNGNSGSP